MVGCIRKIVNKDILFMSFKSFDQCLSILFLMSVHVMEWRNVNFSFRMIKKYDKLSEFLEWQYL